MICWDGVEIAKGELIRWSTVDVTCETLRAYIEEMLGRLHIETLVHGNMLKEVSFLPPSPPSLSGPTSPGPSSTHNDKANETQEAIELAKLAETTLSPRPLTSEELRSHRALIIPEGESLSFFKLFVKGDGSLILLLD